MRPLLVVAFLGALHLACGMCAPGSHCDDTEHPIPIRSAALVPWEPEWCEPALSVDAGTDGGPGDAGVDAGDADAGIGDGGADGGPDDAGAMDAGIGDAGLDDAGLSDAGHSDAGTADAGSPGALCDDHVTVDADAGTVTETFMLDGHRHVVVYRVVRTTSIPKNFYGLPGDR